MMSLLSCGTGILYALFDQPDVMPITVVIGRLALPSCFTYGRAYCAKVKVQQFTSHDLHAGSAGSIIGCAVATALLAQGVAAWFDSSLIISERRYDIRGKTDGGFAFTC